MVGGREGTVRRRNLEGTHRREPGPAGRPDVEHTPCASRRIDKRARLNEWYYQSDDRLVFALATLTLVRLCLHFEAAWTIEEVEARAPLISGMQSSVPFSAPPRRDCH